MLFIRFSGEWVSESYCWCYHHHQLLCTAASSARINGWSARVDSSVYTSGGFLLITNSINDTLLFRADPMCSQWTAGVMGSFRWHENETKIKRLTMWILGLRPAFEHAGHAGFVQLYTLMYYHSFVHLPPQHLQNTSCLLLDQQSHGQWGRSCVWPHLSWRVGTRTGTVPALLPFYQ